MSWAASLRDQQTWGRKTQNEILKLNPKRDQVIMLKKMYQRSQQGGTAQLEENITFDPPQPQPQPQDSEPTNHTIDMDNDTDKATEDTVAVTGTKTIVFNK